MMNRSPSQGIPGAPKRVMDRKERSRAPQVRYRDGQPVTSRGEKFVIETVGDEWDGGSRGKVYTKGKRGPGYR